MLKKKRFKVIILAFFFFLIISKNIYNHHIDEIKTEAMNNYYSYSTNNNSYIAILEIPNISLKEGLFAKESKYNNVKYHIQILEESVMPDQENSILLLAAHSGNSKVSYFNDLENLNIDDNIYLYYKNKKYIYKIDNYYYEEKKGYISVFKEPNILVLTTCSQKNKGYQFIIIANLITID